MTPTKTRKKRSRVGLLLFVLALAAASWYAFDLASRGGASGGKLAYRPLPYVNYGLTPSLERQPGAQGQQRSSNALGFRGRQVETPKPDGRYRIVCLGGSTTYSDLVDDDETYPVHLERLLRERRPDLDIEVVNAGVPSYTSAESLANLVFRCVDLEPDAIVLYQAANDLRTRGYANYDDSYFHFRRVWDGSLDDPTESDMQELAGGINRYIQHDRPESDASYRELVRRSGTGAYRRNLESIVGVARIHGSEPVFVTFLIDHDHEWADEARTEAIAEYNRVMAAVAAEHDVALVDLAERMDHEGMFGDPVHMNAAGTLEKARVVADGMQEVLP